MTTGTCTTCTAPGAACSAGDFCCGGFCDTGTGKCAACWSGSYHACTTDAECCSGLCDIPSGQTQGTCGNMFCKAAGQTCAADKDCCSQSCVDVSGVMTCVAPGAPGSCKQIGGACAVNGDCCSTYCNAGVCAAPPGTGTCKTLGESCAAGADCCSTNCRGGVCVAAYSCQAYGDICHAGTDCCSGICDLAGGTVGGCVKTGGSGGTSNCNQDGTPCSSAANCCTNVCLDLGGGVSVCAVASGCRVTGDYCISDQQCCGGGTNPNGTVTCSGAPNGRCDNGQNCNGVGTICGKAYDPTCTSNCVPIYSTNTNNNCCDGKEACHLDSAGIPRCFGGCPNETCPAGCPYGYTGLPGCCIAAGAECQFTSQCCDGNPCIPDEQDVLRCTAPTCKPLGETCTPNSDGTSDCCGAYLCLTDLEGYTVCQLGGSACHGNGSACTIDADCCSVVCTGGICQAPQTCQAQGGVCTADGDCCTGLTCSFPPGQSSGTCEPGASCPGAGQQCSLSTACCPGLTCFNQGTINDCTGATVCVCGVAY